MKRNRNQFLALSIGFVIMMSLFICGLSVSEAAEHESSGWKFQAVPYLWAAGLDGDVSIGRIHASLDLDFGDILDDLDFAAQGYFEARKDKYGFFVDPTFLKLSSDGAVGPFTIDVDTELWLVDFGVLYQVGEWPAGSGSNQTTELVLLGGGRYLSLEEKINVTVAQISFLSLPGGSLADRAVKKDVTDPFVGARLKTDLSDEIRFVVRGDIGGFGAGTEFSWNIQAAFGYDFSEQITGWIAYRHLNIDIEKDKLDADIAMSGPQLGVSIRF